MLTDYAKKKNQWVTGNYQHGDLVFMNFSNTTATQHIGIVECVKGGYVYTIEGNTSSGDAGSQSNGGMVARRQRALKYIVGAIGRSMSWRCLRRRNGHLLPGEGWLSVRM